MPTRYFVRRPGSEPWYVFRILPIVSVEVYDVSEHAWRSRSLEPLYRWAIIEPEMGVDEISADEASVVIHELEFGRGAGRRRDRIGCERPSAPPSRRKGEDTRGTPRVALPLDP
jgi:hypothetical protein